MSIYQVILNGYDSSTDETDDHVIWVAANNKDQVIQLMDRMKVPYNEVHTTTLGALTQKDGVDLQIGEADQEPYACPKCEGELSLVQTKDWTVDKVTGLLECPSIDNFLSCPACDHAVDESELASEIVNLNLENNTL